MRFWRIVSCNRRITSRLYYLLTVRPPNCNRSKQNLLIWPNYTCFSQSFLIWSHPLGWLGFDFNVIALHPWFVPSCDPFDQIWIVVEVVNISWTMSTRRCFCSKFSNFGAIFVGAKMIHKNILAWSKHYTNIISNLFKSDSTIIKNHFLHGFNVFICCWLQRLLNNYNLSVLCPVLKRGGSTICGNYRSISILPIAYKVLAGVLCEPCGLYQCGFRPGKSIIDQIFPLRQILEKKPTKRKSTKTIFLSIIRLPSIAP